jgi:hypothetical protein
MNFTASTRYRHRTTGNGPPLISGSRGTVKGRSSKLAPVPFAWRALLALGALTGCTPDSMIACRRVCEPWPVREATEARCTCAVGVTEAPPSAERTQRVEPPDGGKR